MESNEKINDYKHSTFVIILTTINFSLCFALLIYAIRFKEYLLILIVTILFIVAVVCLIGYFSKSINAYSRTTLLIAIATVISFLHTIDAQLVTDIASIVGVAGFIYLLVEKVVDHKKT